MRQKVVEWETLDFSAELGAPLPVFERAFQENSDSPLGEMTWSTMARAMAQHLKVDIVYLTDGRVSGRARSARDAGNKEVLLQAFVSQ